MKELKGTLEFEMKAKIPLRVIPLSLLPRPGQNLIRGTLQETKNIKV